MAKYNETGYGEPQYNEGVSSPGTPDPGMPDPSTPYTESIVLHYTYEVRDDSGTLLRVLPKAYNGRRIDNINAPYTLEFDYPSTVAEVAYLVRPYQIWLYDGDRTLLQKYHIRRVSRKLQGHVITVYCESLLSQWSDEIVSYSLLDGVTVLSVLNTLIAAQVHSAPLRLGSLDPSIKNAVVSLELQAQTMLNVLLDLRRKCGGYIWVDPSTRRINWHNKIGEDKGQQIRLTKNLLNVSETEDYTDICTRLYAYGGGHTYETRIKLTDAGESEEYIEEHTATYGTIPRVMLWDNIYDPAELLAVAEEWLSEHSIPRKSYDLEAIDLSELRYDTQIWERLQVGSQVRIVCLDPDVSLKVRIGRLEQDVDRPHRIKLYVAEQDSTTIEAGDSAQETVGGLETMLTSILDRLNDLELRDRGLDLVTWDSDYDRGTLDEALEDLWALTDATTDVATWDGVTDTGTLGGLLDDYLGLTDSQTQISTWTGDPGTSTLDDHLADMGYESMTFGDDIQDIATTEGPGDHDVAARDNHVHKGMPFITAANKTALGTAMTVDGTLGYTTDTYRGYMRSNGALLCYTHLEAT